jgi:hypothetical protein
MIELIGSISFEINVADILNTVVGLILGAFITLGLLRAGKQNKKSNIN